MSDLTSIILGLTGLILASMLIVTIASLILRYKSRQERRIRRLELQIQEENLKRELREMELKGK